MPQKNRNSQGSSLPSNRELIVLFVGVALLTHFSARNYEERAACWRSRAKPAYSHFTVKTQHGHKHHTKHHEKHRQAHT